MSHRGPLRRRDHRAGVYIHVPFCARLCPYCDFAVTIRTPATIPHQAYTEALLAELQARADELDGRDTRTIYIGGGTPSLWDVEELGRTLDAVRAAVFAGDVADVEITLEANPRQVTRERLEAWRTVGINRLSIGCQSFQPRLLKALRRNHSVEEAVGAVSRALEVMPAVSLDLIFGGPDQTLKEWRQDLAMLAGFEGLAHVSAYNLTVEPGTAFAMHQRRGTLRVADEDTCAQMTDELVEACAALGMERYEVSNFARPGARSRHNTNYWLGGEYLGLGVGAHSLCIDEVSGVTRRANPKKLDDYLQDPRRPATREVLSATTHLLERLFLGMRTRAGLDLRELEHQFGGAVLKALLAEAQSLLEEMAAQGFLVYEGRAMFVPTDRGLMMGDTLAERVYERLDT